MRIGEEGGPQGVGGGGSRARGWKGGEGREERPVPPIMAMETGSGGLLGGGGRGGGWGCAPGYVVGRVSILRVGLGGLVNLFGWGGFNAGKFEMSKVCRYLTRYYG